MCKIGMRIFDAQVAGGYINKGKLHTVGHLNSKANCLIRYGINKTNNNYGTLIQLY